VQLTQCLIPKRPWTKRLEGIENSCREQNHGEHAPSNWRNKVSGRSQGVRSADTILDDLIVLVSGVTTQLWVYTLTVSIARMYLPGGCNRCNFRAIFVTINPRAQSSHRRIVGTVSDGNMPARSGNMM
jgi:hypothetical protein